MLVADSLDLMVLIVIVSALALGTALFFLSGILRVKRGTIVVVERIGLFYRTYLPGYYYLRPLVYRRVGIYPLTIIHETLNLKEVKIEIRLKLVDVKTYHYSGIRYQEIISEVVKYNLKNVAEYVSELQLRLLTIGWTILSKEENV